MTHPEKRERRRQMAEAVKSGEKIADVANRHRLDAATVRSSVHEFFPSIKFKSGPKGPRNNPIDPKWISVDWTLNDVTICRRMGVSRERVRQVRNELKKPQVRRWDAPKMRAIHERSEQLKFRIVALVRTGMDFSEVGKATDSTGRYAYVVAAKLIPSNEMERLAKIRHDRRFIDWTAVDWSKRTRDIAKKFDVRQNYVSFRRRKYSPETVGRIDAGGNERITVRK